LLFIFSLITVTFYNVISLGTRYIQNSKNRLAALAVANEKMEIVRNLSYESIGTSGGGSVSGNIPQNEDVTENGKQFHVTTTVNYVDDSFDGIYTTTDLIPGDYKRVMIVVSWDSGSADSQVQLESRFVPSGLETINAGDGILSINVFSDQPGGTGIPNATVQVANSETGLNTTQHTDSSGNIILMGANIKNSIQKYEITVTKTGYETVSTMLPYPATPYNPTYIHASVASGAVNVANIVQNELADLRIATVNYKGESIGDIDFHLEGGKQIGTEVYVETDPVPNEPIYNFDADDSTNSSGEKDFAGISPGQYDFFLRSSITGYEFIGTDPSNPYELVNGAMVYSFPLYSDPPLTLKIKLADKNATSILVSVLKSSDDTPVSGATVHLRNASGYDATQTTLVDGRVFFPEASDSNSFLGGIYDLEITADGFTTSNSQVTVNEGQLKVETIKLDAAL